MKPYYFILGIPVFIFFVLAATLNISPLLRFYSDYDLTPYLAAKSIAEDFDLAYTRNDSDRYFKEELRRPARFFLKKKKIIASSGDTREYPVFFAPDLYTFALVPFVKFFSFRGIFVLQAFLIACIYWIGFLQHNDPANSLVYYTLVPLPFLFFIPSHHLFLFAAISGAIFFALRKDMLWSAILIAIASSSQFWSILFAIFFLGHWKATSEEASRQARFLFVLIVSLLFVWGIQHAMYPGKIVSETRWVTEIPDRPVAEVWNQLLTPDTGYFTTPHLQQVIDLIFGRTVGVFVYGFAACAMMLAAIWMWRNPLISRGLLFILLLILLSSFTNPVLWNIRLFASDFSIFLWAIPIFLFPLLQNRAIFYALIFPSLLFTGPMLANPLGVITDRYYYLQIFPYRYFPQELSLVGKVGRTAKPDYRQTFAGGTIFFLNDNFYHDQDFFWIKGESTLEFLLKLDSPIALRKIKIQSGNIDDRVIVKIGKRKEEVRIGPEESTYVEMKNFEDQGESFEGKYYLHGKIESKSGYAPKLLSRENPDYRYLGCQIHLIP